MQAVHQAAAVPPQSFGCVLDLPVPIQHTDPFNGLRPAAGIHHVLNEIIRMTASFLLYFNYIPLAFPFANGYNLYHVMNFENIANENL